MTPVDLIFDWGSPAPVDLVFGETAAPPKQVTFSAALAAPGFAGQVVRCKPVTLAAALPGPGGVVLAEYDSNTQRPLTASTNGGWQSASTAEVGATAGHALATPTSAGVSAVHQTARPAGTSIGVEVQQATPTGRALRAPHGPATGRRTPTRVAWQEAGRDARRRLLTAWCETTAMRTARRSIWRELRRDRRPLTLTTWARSGPLRRMLRESAAPAAPLHPPLCRTVPWGEARRPPAGRWQPAPPAPPGPAQSRWSPHLVFDALHPAGLHLVFAGGGGSPPSPATVVVPIRSVYMTANAVTLHRVSDNVALTPLSLRMALDVDSWTWSWSSSLPAAELPLVESAAGEPLHVQVGVNGTLYRLLIERIARDRSFGQARITVSGRGRNAVLADPYADQRVFTNAEAITAAQLLDDALTDNNVSIGWTVDFGLTDWLVPAGAWSHQGTWLTAVQSVAQAVGGYLQPHRTAQTLRLLHRWPTAPWGWAALTADLELPTAPVVREAIEWVDKPLYNRVFVSGAAGGGILGQVTRAGTAGDWVAPMVVDPLITHADAARQRGRAVLSDTGRQAQVSLSLPVLPETGVIEPGTLLRYTDGATLRLGLVRSTALEAQREVLRQTIGVQTHVA